GSSDVLAARAQLGEHDVDALLVDRAEPRVREAEAHPAVLAFDPEAPALQVGQEPPTRLVVRVGDVMARHGGLSGDLTDSSHGSLLKLGWSRAAWKPWAQQSLEL